MKSRKVKFGSNSSAATTCHPSTINIMIRAGIRMVLKTNFFQKPGFLTFFGASELSPPGFGSWIQLNVLGFHKITV
ncbi:MAG: hypothetical protein ACFFCS_14180 [Candidatus Hodarchaeota archaeon]